MKTVIKIALSIVAIVAFALIFSYSLDKSEIVHCNKLISQSEEFAQAGFYITSLESEMCNAHGIAINAPVK